MSEPVAPPRAPSGPKTLAASLLSLVAIACLLFGMVGLLRSETVSGLLLAGVVFVGGGLVLARRAWRLYRGTPSLFRLVEGRPPEEARALARESARQQWLGAAKFLLALVPVYLLLALLLTDREAALGAAALVAITSGGLGLLSWWAGRRSSLGASPEARSCDIAKGPARCIPTSTRAGTLCEGTWWLVPRQARAAASPDAAPQRSFPAGSRPARAPPRVARLRPSPSPGARRLLTTER